MPNAKHLRTKGVFDCPKQGFYLSKHFEDCLLLIDNDGKGKLRESKKIWNLNKK